MKASMTFLTLFGMLLFTSLGCEPRPATNDPNVPDDVETDVDMTDEADDADIIAPPTTTPPVTTPPAETVPPADSPADTIPSDSGVDVGVGEEGVNVDVNPNGTGTDVNVETDTANP